jgi:hypothetical protein
VKQEWYKKERKAKLSEETLLQTQKKDQNIFFFVIGIYKNEVELKTELFKHIGYFI